MTMTEERIIAYLLGVMPEDERERFEDECFSQEEWPAELSRVEEELIEDYLRGELTPEQSRLFKLNYMTTKAREGQIAGAAVMLHHADRRHTAPAGFWAFLNGPLWARASAAALALVVVAAGVWWFARPGSPQPDAVLLSLNISNSDRASGLHEGRVSIPPGARELRLTLTLPDGSAQATRYRTELVNDVGETKPSSVVGQDARTVSVATPAAQLPRGRYAVKLFAAGADGAEQRVRGSYFFTIE